ILAAGALVNNLDFLQGTLTVHGGGTLLVLDTNAPAKESFTLTAGSLSRVGSGAIVFDPTLSQLQLYAGAFDDQILVQSVPVMPVGLIGGNGANTLIGPGDNMLWKITGSNAGLLGDHVHFSQFQNLTGGSGDDHFVIQNNQGVSGVIKGGTGANVLDFGS